MPEHEIDVVVRELVGIADPVKIILRENDPKDMDCDSHEIEICVVVSDDADKENLSGKCYNAVWDCLFNGKIGRHDIATYVQSESSFHKATGKMNSIASMFAGSGKTVYEK